LKNPFRFFCVVLKTTKVMASTFINRKSSVCKKQNKTTTKKLLGNFERGRSRCLTSGSLPLRFDLSDDCVRAVGETGEKGETRDGKEKDDEKNKKQK
jgi:hypothetical protein